MKKTMRKFVCLALLMMSFVAVKAQWSVSPELGLSMVNRPGIVNSKWDNGWKVGVGVEYQFSPMFSLKSGLHYTQRGWELSFIPWLDQEGELSISTGDSKRHFLQLPVMAQLGWDLGKDIRLNVAAGPYIAYCVHHNYSYGTYSNFTHYGYGGYGYGYGSGGTGSSYGGYRPFDGLRSFDWGASFAVGLEVKNLYFNIGYDLSLGEEYPNDGLNVNYHTLSLTVGYKFRL